MMGKVDIAARILEFASKEPSLKLLEAKMDLSNKVLDDNLKLLTSKDLIGISKTDKKVSITKRGTKFLELYNSIHAKYLTVSV